MSQPNIQAFQVDVGLNDLTDVDTTGIALGDTMVWSGSPGMWSPTPLKQIGVNQTWQDVTLSRSVGVVYQNTTGNQIQVNIVIAPTGSPIAQDHTAKVENTTPPTVSVARIAQSGSTSDRMTISFIVPDNHYYELVETTAGVIETWSELR